jgi:serine protease Do
VTKGSPAEAAGLRRGDVILRFEGKEIAESHALPALVAAAPVGKEAMVTIRRDGKEEQLRVTVGRMPSERAEASESARPDRGRWGLALREVDPGTAKRWGMAAGEGVLVAAVQPGSPAASAGVRPGDVILEVNRQKVASVQEAQAEIRKTGDGDSLLLLLRRGDSTRFAVLTGGEKKSG